MREYCRRLTKGADLKESIEAICLENKFDTVVVLSAVGCLYKANIRLANARTFLQSKNDYEIVSLMGTVCKGHCHLHIALSDENGQTIGGHLAKGCLINTTCELVLGVLQDYESDRPYDEKTGWDEIEFKEVKHD